MTRGSWSGDPRLRRERRVEFLGEQDGQAERTFKSELRAVFLRYPKVERAYLARIGFSPRSQPSVALCICPSAAELRDVVDEVQRSFARLFAEEVELDILFPTRAEEEDLRRVCRAFFEKRKGL